jgi:hypothetical protein
MDTSIFILDNNIIINDSDSDTSTTSTVEELKNHNNKNIESNVKTNIKTEFVKPIQSHSYFDKEQNKDIDDGFELSLLRLLHIWFSKDGVINFSYLTKHMDQEKVESIELEEFFLNNPGVMFDSEFYLSEAGIKNRKSWYEFLSNRKFFKYVHNTNQLSPHNSNFLSFIKEFFPFVNFNEIYNEQEKLTIIYNTFSYGLYKFSVLYLTDSHIDNENINDKFIHNIFINDIEVFLFESINIKQISNSNHTYWTKTELRYS